ncbi:hypothetical protein [Pseudomonas baetica]|uniref:antitoxin PaaA2 family protein n=1 Tax=Pseudomonas baetica TaxID=674054 RepID=UPI003D662F1F
MFPYNRWFRAKVQSSLDDPRPNIPDSRGYSIVSDSATLVPSGIKRTLPGAYFASPIAYVLSASARFFGLQRRIRAMLRG